MAVREILLLGNPQLYQVSSEVEIQEMDTLKPIAADLHDTLISFRQKYGAGRAVAAPQIGIMKRIIYMYIDEPVLFVNPRLEFEASEKMLVWDDCMSFPELLVRVERYKKCKIYYRDIHWREQCMLLQDDLSELLQHEYDHLDGILAVMRAVDKKSLALRSQKEFLA